MPPRKSNISTTAPEDDPIPKPTPMAARDDDSLGVEDLNLPKSMVQRLAKGVLPPNTQIQKDALLAMSKSATVFVNYLTSCAAEHAQRGGKKTIMPADVYSAMKELEFDFMLHRLEAEVAKFTSIQADKRNTYRKKVREEKKAATGGAMAEEGGGASESIPNGGAAGGGDDEGDSPPAAKRARRGSGAGQSADEEDGEGDETVDVEDEEVEDDEIEEEEEEVVEEGLTEDPLEEKEDKDEDDEMADGDESD